VKASELIERLNAIIAEHGDLPVCNERMDRYEDNCLYDVCSVSVRDKNDEEYFDWVHINTKEECNKYIDIW
jgi:hypothetical protein